MCEENDTWTTGFLQNDKTFVVEDDSQAMAV